MSGLEFTNTVSVPLLASVCTAIGVAGARLLDSWRAKSRVDRVDVPQAQAQGWVELFKIANETGMRQSAEIAVLGKRLDDQDEEHRVELAERDRRYNELAELQRDTAGSLRRLRKYVVIVTDLLATNAISFPPMPDEELDIPATM